jgi:hypothetical protein
MLAPNYQTSHACLAQFSFKGASSFSFSGDAVACPVLFAGLVALFEDSYVLRVVFTILVWLQLCTSALHVGRSVFWNLFLEHLSLCCPAGGSRCTEEGWETVSVIR